MSFLSSEGSLYASAVLPVIKGAVGWVETGLSVAPVNVASGATYVLTAEVLPAGVYQINYMVVVDATAGSIEVASLQLLYGATIQTSSGGAWTMDIGNFSVSAIVVSDGITAFSAQVSATTGDASVFVVARKQFSLCRVA